MTDKEENKITTKIKFLSEIPSSPTFLKPFPNCSITVYFSKEMDINSTHLIIPFSITGNKDAINTYIRFIEKWLTNDKMCKVKKINLRRHSKEMKLKTERSGGLFTQKQNKVRFRIKEEYEIVVPTKHINAIKILPKILNHMLESQMEGAEILLAPEDYDDRYRNFWTSPRYVCIDGSVKAFDIDSADIKKCEEFVKKKFTMIENAKIKKVTYFSSHRCIGSEVVMIKEQKERFSKMMVIGFDFE